MNSALLNHIRAYFTGSLESKANTLLLLQGKLASRQLSCLKTVSSLNQVEFKIYSQWGEDGIIDWLTERAQLPRCLWTFIEIGIESYAEANTRFLLENRNWRGLVIDGNAREMELLKRRDGYLFWKYDLNAKLAFVNRENINDLLNEAGFCGEIGLLSIDIDGNDYWVWEAIEAIHPVICICEYNAVFGDILPISIPYQPGFVRTRPEFHSLYFGASIGALQSLAKKKGYRFLGTNSEGVNAFFVREDYASTFEPLLAHAVAQPSKFRESRDRSGRPSFARGLERLQLIQELPVINTETLDQQRLGDLKPLYSDEWLDILESPARRTAAGAGRH